MPAPISVLILTLNQEGTLRNCLESVSWSDDIVVFDSFSTDKTVEIAKAFGARVVQRKFDSEYDLRAASLAFEFKHPWVCNPDADEIITPSLRDEMFAAVNDPAQSNAAFRVRIKTMFMDKWLRHSGLYPTWAVRLFRPEKARIERSVNISVTSQGPIAPLQGHVERYAFRNGLTDWFARHNHFSTEKAAELLDRPPVCWRDLFGSNPMRRRTALKNLSFHLPGRPLLVFFYLYLFRRGFLDGQRGLTYCSLRAVYEFQINVKALEFRRKRRQALAAVDAAAPAPPPAERPDCSVLILTLNEECNIQRCISSVSWCDDVVVFDSGSTDRTAELSEKLGARVFYRKFDNYAAQRNAALADVPYRHPWVLMLDADECTDPPLVPELAQTIRKSPPAMALFRLRRKDYFLDRWIRSSSGFPTWFARVMKVGFVQFQREVHEDAVAQGQVGVLQGFLTHQPFSKGVSDWFDRHNRYSQMEARMQLSKHEYPPLRILMQHGASTRRRILKSLAYVLPGRPYLVFLYLYVCRLGLLEGRPGFIYCVLRGVYEFMINVKIRELRRLQKGLLS